MAIEVSCTKCGSIINTNEELFCYSCRDVNLNRIAYLESRLEEEKEENIKLRLEIEHLGSEGAHGT